MRGRAGGTEPQTMARLVYILTVCVWTAEAAQLLHPLIPLYTDLKNSENLHCKCEEKQCLVVWCRKLPGQDEFQFLLSYNSAGKSIYGSRFNETKFQGSTRDNSKFILTIMSLEKGDAGLYFCILQRYGVYGLGSPVIDLRVGEKPPTLPPPRTTRRVKDTRSCPCRDRGKPRPPRGCSRLVAWPLVGVLLSLAVVLIATLLYFSRLPKKCRHQFAKK